MSVEPDLANDLGLTRGPLPVGGLPRPYVLTIDGGFSSVKFALHPVAGPTKPIVAGRIERISREPVECPGDTNRRGNCDRAGDDSPRDET